MLSHSKKCCNSSQVTAWLINEIERRTKYCGLSLVPDKDDLFTFHIVPGSRSPDLSVSVAYRCPSLVRMACPLRMWMKSGINISLAVSL